MVAIGKVIKGTTIKGTIKGDSALFDYKGHKGETKGTGQRGQRPFYSCGKFR